MCSFKLWREILHFPTGIIDFEQLNVGWVILYQTWYDTARFRYPVTLIRHISRVIDFSNFCRLSKLGTKIMICCSGDIKIQLKKFREAETWKILQLNDLHKCFSWTTDNPCQLEKVILGRAIYHSWLQFIASWKFIYTLFDI